MESRDSAPALAPLAFLVDDERTTLVALEGILRRAGIRTASATTAFTALIAIRALQPDIVLLDMNLGDGSGLDVCRTLHSAHETSPIPVIFVSVDHDTATKVQGFTAGAVDYITKPIAPDEVLARVRTHLRLSSSSRSLCEQTRQVRGLARAKQALLPQPAALPGARFGVAMQQVLEAGGDFYDVIPRGDDVYDYLIADASGHDLASSYWTAALKALAASAAVFSSPGKVVHYLNDCFCRFLPPGAFFTLVYVRFDRKTGDMTIINAAHPPAILLRKHVQRPETILQRGDVVGSFPDALFGCSQIRLGPGDRIFFYSDGAIEISASPQRDLSALCSACVEVGDLPLDLAPAHLLRRLTGGASVRDDVVLMAVEG